MKLKAWYGATIITVVSVAIGIYASFLNQIFYINHAPFFDSNSYQMTLLRVLEICKEAGILSGLSFAATQTRTVTLPFIQAALMSPWIENPVRHLTPFIMLPWLLCFSLSLYAYFHKFLNQGLWTSIILTLPFISVFAFWFYNGGIVDFRMDILQYLLLSTAFVWYLSSRYSISYLSWLLAGLFLGLACLARATTPVFAIICLVPLIGARIVFCSQKRQQTIVGSLISILACSVISAWFFIINFDDLYQYYAVWNIDANASLPLSQSIRHLSFAFRNIGFYALTASLVLFFIRLLVYVRRQYHLENGISFIQSSINFLRFNLDWESLWLGLAPILFLVFRRAGLNPFVSMPAMFGIIMFLVSPGGFSQTLKIPVKPIFASNSNASFISYIMIFSIFLASTLSGLEHHLYPNQGRLFRSMAPQQSIVETIAQDLASQNKIGEKVYMATTFMTSLNDSSLRNILAFDYRYRSSHREHDAWVSQLQLPPASYPAQTFNRVQSPFDWSTVSGTTDQEKIASLVEIANQSLDYAILPMEESFAAISRINPHVIVNRYAGEIKSQLLTTGSWTAIGTPIQVDHNQVIQIYRNERTLQ